MTIEVARAEAAQVARAPAASTGAGEPDDAAVGFGMTPREQDVLRLLAEGRSDREIASALSISRKTAGVHVGNILAKLGARSRGEAIAFAHRAGFVPSGRPIHPRPPVKDSSLTLSPRETHPN